MLEDLIFLTLLLILNNFVRMFKGQIKFLFRRPHKDIWPNKCCIHMFKGHKKFLFGRNYKDIWLTNLLSYNNFTHILCYLQTGTLTEDGLDFWGIVPTYQEK